MQNSDKLIKRARRKYLNTPLLKQLLLLESPLHKKYEHTLSCSSAIRVQDGKTQSRYCKRMWCSICQPIRTAIRINNYCEQLEAIPELQFTTLTAQNCEAHQIRSVIQNFRAFFRQWRNTYKKRTGTVFQGVYNFEVTYNHKTDKYHPHIHILHTGLQLETNTYYKNGTKQQHFINDLCADWCDKSVNYNLVTSLQAQDSRPVEKDEEGNLKLVEAFKYQSLSIFKIKINGKKQPFIPVIELDRIYQQLEGLRCFQPFGINKISEEKEEEQMDELTAYDVNKPESTYIWRVHDWFSTQYFGLDHDTGELLERHEILESEIIIPIETPLSNFKPDKKTQYYYETIERNEHYRSEVFNAKRIYDLSRPEMQEECPF